MGFKMKEPSVIGGTQKHTDAIEAQRSASINVQKANCECGKEICDCGDSPTKFCKFKHLVGSTLRVKNSLGNQTRLKKKAKKRKIKEERKRIKKNKNTGSSNSRTLPPIGSSKIYKTTN